MSAVAKVTQVPGPPVGFEGEVRYAIRAREKRSFHTILDAHRMISRGADPVSVVRHVAEPGGLRVEMDHPILHGTLTESLSCTQGPDGLLARALARRSVQTDGRVVRDEKVEDFLHDEIGLPRATYPEVFLPFLLCYFPRDDDRRSVYAWINDRFVAKVYFERVGRTTIKTASGRSIDVEEAVMYPDLNDWVALGSLLSRLAKPFAPKYRMWFELASPWRVARFEGPYGPPGAPEVVLERLD